MSLTLSQFLSTLDDVVPPDEVGPALQALWWAHRSDWEAAHEIIQAHEGKADCDWVHAWLHRREGDLPNARYWYRRASRPISHADLDSEWRQIVTALLANSGY